METWGDVEEESEARRKATFCLRLGVAPSEYDGLTDDEIDAFVEVFNEIHEEQQE